MEPTDKWVVSESDVERPYVISVDADIPDGSRIVVQAIGSMPGGAPWREEFVNPTGEPISFAWCQSFDLIMTPAPGSIAVPFLYSIIIEGDRTKRVLPAEAFTVRNGASGPPIVLMPADNGRKFLTVETFPGTLVSTSTVGRPWVASLSAWIPPVCRVQLTMLIQLKNGQYATLTVEGIEPAILPFTEVVGIQHRIEMSGDGTATPAVSGLALDGDGRRYYWPAKSLMWAQRPSIEEFLNRPHPDHKANFSAVTQHSIQPPPAVLRLTKLFQEGAFTINEDKSSSDVP